MSYLCAVFVSEHSQQCRLVQRFRVSSARCRASSGGFRIFRRGYLGLAYFILAVLVVYLIVGICRKGVSMDTSDTPLNPPLARG